MYSIFIKNIYILNYFVQCQNTHKNECDVCNTYYTINIYHIILNHLHTQSSIPIENQYQCNVLEEFENELEDY